MEIGNREARTKGARRGGHAKINAAGWREAHKRRGPVQFNGKVCAAHFGINNLHAIRAGTKCAHLLAKNRTHIDKFSNGVILFG